ncbi:MAG: MBG domain-containing protein, partial [Roseimicrobium sp.]
YTVTVTRGPGFTHENVLVERVGDGSATLGSTAGPVAILEFSGPDTLVQTLTTEFTGSNLLTDSTSATSNGYLNSYGEYLAVTGYNAALGTASVASQNVKVTSILGTAATVLNRVTFPTSGTMPFTGNNLRSAIPTSATTFYASGAGSNPAATSGGIWYYDGSSFTQLNTTITNTRVVGISHGQLYFSTGSGSSRGIYTLGTGLPTTGSQTASLRIDTGSSSSPYGFVLFDTNSDGSPDRAYVADDRASAGGGLQRWDLSGSTWSNTYTRLFNTADNSLTTATGTGIVGIRGLTGIWDASSSSAMLIATTVGTATDGSNNKLVMVEETTATPTTFTTVANAGASYAFRGVTFAPGLTPEVTTTGTLAALSTTYGTASATTSFSVSGTNLEEAIAIEPPTGFEVSTMADFSSNVGRASEPLSVGAAGTVSATTVYVRLAANAPVTGSPYSGNIRCFSAQANARNVATVASTVNAASLTITGVTADSKTYDGSSTATLTGTPVYVGQVGTDNFTVQGVGAASFDTANVGTAKPVSVTGYAAPSTNYTVSQPVGLTADITPKPATVAAQAQSKTYGDADPALTYTATGLLTGDSLTGELTRAAGENVGAYAIAQGTVTAGANYAITFTGADLTIAAKALAIAAEPKSKTYGDADPALTYTATGLLTGDSFTGALTRAAGENIGAYAIALGTLSAGANYNTSFTGADLVISAKGLTIAGAAVASKAYDGTTGATITGTLAGVVPG